MTRGLTRRAGPLFGLWLVGAAVLAVCAPAVPVAQALDPTPDPSPSVMVDPGLTPDPGASPSADPSIAPSVDPGVSPSADPGVTPDPAASAAPLESPSAPPSEKPGFHILLDPTVNATSPHIVVGLTADGCAGCHFTHRAQAQYLLGTAYRAEPLRTSSEPWSATDFGLCWTCHNSTPFTTDNSPGSNFPDHYRHVGNLAGSGSGGTDITVPGDGQGNAICAECHYNLHGVATDARGLVKFAPNVEAFLGTLEFDAVGQTCTLRCHGKDHDHEGY